MYTAKQAIIAGFTSIFSASLIISIDTDEHNDVEIIFEDGVIEASKLILSTTRSADFQKVFNKNIQFQEQKKISVQFPCKELTIKMKIL